MSNCDIKHFDKNDEKELMGFIKDNWDAKHPLLNEKLFSWMYKNKEIYIYTDNNKIVGFNNYIKTQYQYNLNGNQQRIDSIQFAMSKVLDKYNGLNIILKPHTEYNIICGMGFNRNTILPILKQLNYKIIDPVPRVHIKPSKITDKNIDDTKTYNIIEDVDCKQMEKLWMESTLNTNICGIYRNEYFWKWRYIDNPSFKNKEKYHFFGNLDIGVIVFRKEKYLNNYACRIVELIPRNDKVWCGIHDFDFNCLIHHFCNWCNTANISIIDFYCTHIKLLDVLVKNNFQYSDSTIPNNFGNPEKRYPELNYVIYSTENIDITELYETKSCGDMDRPDGNTETKFNIALLSSINIDPLKMSVAESLSNHVENANIYTCEYGQLQQNLLFDDSDLSKHNPNIIFVIDRPEDILNKSLDEYIEDDRLKIKTYFDAIRVYISNHSNAQIFIMDYFYTEKTIQFNCINKGILHIFTKNLQQLQSEFPSNIDIMTMHNINDCEILDKRMWYIGKIPYTTEFFNKISTKIIGLILSIKGLTSRLLVLDLDNTLWGGVVGEDGVNGIKIGEDYPGNIFRDFQKKIKLLKERGVALAICSKNDINIVNDVFEQNSNMILKKEDFVFIYANWNNKFENIKEISTKIGLGLKNILFIDDNPVEREQVKQFLPEVQVLELSKDPIGYIDCLLESPFLEIHKLTESDRTRAETYVNKVKIDELKTTFTNKEDFYKQLELEIHIHNLTNENKDRCVQLINKTNQFNATSLRLTENELANYKIYVLGAKDKYNDYENMGILVTSETDETVTIENYLMSCRFLGKGLENEFIKWVLQYAKLSKHKNVCGKIIITDRNEPVRNIYKQNGFVLENEQYIYNINEDTIVDFKEYIQIHDNTSNISNTKLKPTTCVDIKPESGATHTISSTTNVNISNINPILINIIKKLLDIKAHSTFDKMIEDHELPDEFNYLPSWSSLKHIMLINSVEREFGIKMGVDKIMKIKRLSQLNTVIQNIH